MVSEIQERKVVLLGFGRTSRPFAENVQKILKERYEIESELPLEEEVNPLKEGKIIKGAFRYRDNEVSSKFTTETARKLFTDSLVYITQFTRIYDDDLEFWAKDFETRLGELDESVEDLGNDELSGKVADLKELIAKFGKYVDVGGERKYAAIRSVPDVNIRKVIGLADIASRFDPRVVRLVTPKSSYEWNHNSKKYSELGLEEANALRSTILNYRLHGIDGWIAMHLHAPKDVLEHAHADVFGLPEMDVVNVNPQSYTTINGETINLERIFNGLRLGFEDFHSYDELIGNLILGQQYGNDLPYDLAKQLIVVDCSDQGALDVTTEVAKCRGLYLVTSEKSRSDEGESERSGGISLNDYLDRLTKCLGSENIDPKEENVTFTIVNLDDKLNSGNTANIEAAARKEEVDIYNRGINADCFAPDDKKSREEKYQDYVTSFEEPNEFLKEFPEGHGTKFNAEFHLYLTHIRTPDLRRLKHEHIDKIVVSDTVPYYPGIFEQLEHFEHVEKIPDLQGITSKLKILPISASMVAAGIALDVYMQDRFYRNYVDSL